MIKVEWKALWSRSGWFWNSSIAKIKANQTSQILAKSDIRFWDMVVESLFVFYHFCQLYIDKINEESWQNVLMNINFFTNILWVNLYAT